MKNLENNVAFAQKHLPGIFLSLPFLSKFTCSTAQGDTVQYKYHKQQCGPRKIPHFPRIYTTNLYVCQEWVLL